LYYAQRGIVQPTIRSAITAGLAAAIRWRHPFNRGQGDSIWHAVDRSAILRTLDTDGIAVLPERLSVQVAEMKRFLRDRPLVLRSGELVDRKRVPPGCTMADYQLETVLNCPHVLALANSDFLIRTATQYIGCLPTISTLRIWWTFPGSERQEVHSFHRDREDWRGLTVFVYLGDVDKGSGPHHFVRGSHRTRPERFWRAHEVEALEKAFGRDAILAVTGSAGTAFLTDSIGIHAGPAPIDQPRLVLQVAYTLLPRFSLLYNPVQIESRPVVDQYINRLYVRQ
jgi:hypothetical protein